MSTNSNTSATLSRNGSFTHDINNLGKQSSEYVEERSAENGLNEASSFSHNNYSPRTKRNSIFEDVSDVDVNGSSDDRIQQFIDAYDGSSQSTGLHGAVDQTLISHAYIANDEEKSYMEQSETSNTMFRNETEASLSRQYSTINSQANHHYHHQDELETNIQRTGPILPLSAYKLQYDSNPVVVQKAMNVAPPIYRQNVHIRFLQPPPLPQPGPLIIKEVREPQARPAPPLVIRQRPPRPPTPPPLILRERPPPMPPVPGPKVIQKHLPALPPPPRQVIIERYPPEPPRPRNIVIERWLPYGPMPKRKVIYQKAEIVSKYKTAKNMIVNIEAPRARVERVLKKLPVEQMDPATYLNKYAHQLLDSNTLLSAARQNGVLEDITPPNTSLIGSNYTSDLSEVYRDGNEERFYNEATISQESSYLSDILQQNTSLIYDSAAIADMNNAGNLKPGQSFFSYANNFAKTDGSNGYGGLMHKSNQNTGRYQPFNDVIQHLETSGGVAYAPSTRFHHSNVIDDDELPLTVDNDSSNNELGMLSASLNYESGSIEAMAPDSFQTTLTNGFSEIHGETYAKKGTYEETNYDYESNIIN